jgi:hypothetical protein
MLYNNGKFVSDKQMKSAVITERFLSQYKFLQFKLKENFLVVHLLCRVNRV